MKRLVIVDESELKEKEKEKIKLEILSDYYGFKINYKFKINDLTKYDRVFVLGDKIYKKFIEKIKSEKINLGIRNFNYTRLIKLPYLSLNYDKKVVQLYFDRINEIFKYEGDDNFVELSADYEEILEYIDKNIVDYTKWDTDIKKSDLTEDLGKLNQLIEDGKAQIYIGYSIKFGQFLSDKKSSDDTFQLPEVKIFKPNQYKEFLNLFDDKDCDLAFDFESSGFPYEHNFELIGLGIADKDNVAYIELLDCDEKVLKEILKFFKNNSTRSWCFNIGFEGMVFRRLFNEVIYFNDLMALAICDNQKYNLKYLAQYYLKVPSWDTEFEELSHIALDIFKRCDYDINQFKKYYKKDQINELGFDYDRFIKYFGNEYKVIPTETMGTYCGYDSFYTLKLVNHIGKDKYPKAYPVYLKNAILGLELTKTGLIVDRERLIKLIKMSDNIIYNSYIALIYIYEKLLRLNKKKLIKLNKTQKYLLIWTDYDRYSSEYKIVKNYLTNVKNYGVPEELKKVNEKINLIMNNEFDESSERALYNEIYYNSISKYLDDLNLPDKLEYLIFSSIDDYLKKFKGLKIIDDTTHIQRINLDPIIKPMYFQSRQKLFKLYYESYLKTEIPEDMDYTNFYDINEKDDLKYDITNTLIDLSDVETDEDLKRKLISVNRIFSVFLKIKSTYLQGTLMLNSKNLVQSLEDEFYINGYNNIFEGSKDDTYIVRPYWAVNQKSTKRWSSNIHTFQQESDELSIFIPEDDKIFVYFDISQAEIRTIAYTSQDKKLIEYYEKDIDIYSDMVNQMFGNTISKEEFKFYRSLVKTIVLGIFYGRGVSSIKSAVQYKLKDDSVVDQLYKNFIKNFKRTMIFVDKKRKFAENTGYIDTLFGDKIESQEGRHYTCGINYYVQNSTAVILAEGFLNLYLHGKKKNLEFSPKLVVHDSATFSVPVKNLPLIYDEFKEGFYNYLKNKYGIPYKYDLILHTNLKTKIKFNRLNPDHYEFEGDENDVRILIEKIKKYSTKKFKILKTEEIKSDNQYSTFKLNHIHNVPTNHNLHILNNFKLPYKLKVEIKYE